MYECNMSDESLVRSILQGDENAFTQLYDRYRLRIYSISFRIIQDYEEAQDATQEIFFKIYRSLHQWDALRSKLSTWIYRLALNHSIDCRRVRFRRTEFQLLEFGAEPVFPKHSNGPYACSPFKAVKNKEEVNLIWKHIDKLPVLQKKTFIRRYFQELKLVEIAKIECCKLATVKTSLYRATHSVRKILLESGACL